MTWRWDVIAIKIRRRPSVEPARNGSLSNILIAMRWTDNMPPAHRLAGRIASLLLATIVSVGFWGPTGLVFSAGALDILSAMVLALGSPPCAEQDSAAPTQGHRAERFVWLRRVAGSPLFSELGIYPLASWAVVWIGLPIWVGVDEYRRRRRKSRPGAELRPE